MQQFHLPDTLVEWPYPPKINPQYSEVTPVSVAWLESFKDVDAQALRAINKSDLTLLASAVYPFAKTEHLRTACDFTYLTFLFDEYSDVENEHGVRALGDIIMDALRNPDKARPSGESVLGEIARQFWKLAIRTASPSSQRRFIDSYDRYISAVVKEAKDRTHHRIRDIESYFNVRRGSLGAKPLFSLFELDMDLPDEVVNHPTIQALETYAIDMLILGNDIWSYNKEQARGDKHNVVVVIMHQLKTDIQGAIDWIASYHKELETVFLAKKADMPAWGDVIDEQVNRYIFSLGNSLRGNETWSFTTERYFGKKGREVRESRIVQLLPAVH